ncbi:hypothetical protein [Leifsonia shinshuensis]|uniref:Uncharacterized protein n=1 Tax=Leifsonia shinshuensis TaxID=150026 RepID=A0A853CV42_9MICO|nr:hypothetical protein [Leifsonia shinshuensis]NYJ24537.1 hypothetical protein [Leifsonia shinshuensis]
MTEPAEAEADPQTFLTELVESVGRALPPALAARVLVIERKRTLADRLFGRAGAIARVSLIGPEETLTLGYEPGPHWRGEVDRVYGGVTIARRPLGLGDWLTAFAGRVAALAAQAAGDAANSSRALQTLGLEPVGSEVQVRDATIEADLRTLPARLGRRVPDEAVALVGRIGDLLIDALPRVAGQGEQEVVVRRTATVYLPDTLRAYLSLPADWTADHVLPDGTKASEALIAQLGELERAAKRLRDAAVEHDASALLVNGRFLAERFGVSRLDLP